MSEEHPTQSGEEASERSTLTRPSERPDWSRMRARTWVIAYCYADPAEYGIPKLPEWNVSRTDSSGLSFAEDDESEPFISAEQPVRVRR
jgi:hypothetical protein